MKFKRAQRFYIIFSVFMFLSLLFSPIREFMFGKTPKTAFGLQKGDLPLPAPSSHLSPTPTPSYIPPTHTPTATVTPQPTAVPTERPPSEAEIIQR